MGSFLLGIGGVGGGGGGLHFRDPVDVFADAAARTAAFGSGGADEGEHTQFAIDRSLAIIIGTIANPTNFQTYTGSTGTYDDAAWLNRTDAVQGRTGADGQDGAPGGGAWESIGMFSTTANRGASVFVGTGLTIPAGRIAVAYRLANTVANLANNAGMMVLSLTALAAKDRASAGDTSADASRVTLPEFNTGGNVSGFIYGGLTSARELLLATSGANTFLAIELFDYVPSSVQGGLNAQQVDARIAPPARVFGPSGAFAAVRIPDLNASKITAGELADARIPAAIARDSEIPTDAEIDARADARVTAGTKSYARTGGGQVPDGDIPAGIARDSEIRTDAQIEALADAQIAAGVKIFARTGERSVLVGDMDSGTATDNQVPTADGSGGVAWEDQQDAPTPPPATHLRYAALRTADNMFTVTDFEAATAETSTSNLIDTPDTDTDSFLGFAVPATGALSDIRQENGLFSYFASFTLSPNLVELGGEDHRVYASDFALNSDVLGGNWVLTPA